ncbi:hypothetical protein CHCC20442_2435 [Bacillus licheniformis]|uniref:hypothetical protein n=1 Tax=Bacillus licheniformis TaxID=1402 RepID=UPI0011A58D00|nr:hypothetical protein [Bacillus licheniformis]TWJ97289.1 hypothetical protein CHCC20442_2435 [Bacillus licheniformis]
MNLIIRLVKLKGCWEDLVPKMRCDASSIITNNPESGKSRRDFTAERKRYRERYGYPPIDRQCLGTKKNDHKKSWLPNSSAALFASFTREFRVTMNGNVHKHYFWRNSPWL